MRKWKIQYATSAIERMKELTDSAEKINSRRNCRNTFVTCVSDVYLFLVDKIRQNTTIQFIVSRNFRLKILRSYE